MEFTEVVRQRRMTRRYDPDRPVGREVLRSLLDLATRAPSAGFTQGWHFLVLDDPASVAAYWQATAGDRIATEAEDQWLRGMRTAPVVIVVLCDKDAYLTRYAQPDKVRSTAATDERPEKQRWPVPYWQVDAGMAAVILLLAATDLGLGSCFFGVPAPAHDAVRARFGLEPGLSIVGAVTIGHRLAESATGSQTLSTNRSDGESRPPRPRRPRRPLDEVVTFGR